MDMIMYVLSFPYETPDRNDVLITNFPTSIPESDWHVARGIFWSLTCISIMMSCITCISEEPMVVWVFMSKLCKLRLYQENHTSQKGGLWYLWHSAAEQTRNVQHTVGGCSKRASTTIGKRQNIPRRRVWVHSIFVDCLVYRGRNHVWGAS